MNRTPPVVAVTGAAGYIGSHLLQELERDEALARVVAIDTTPLKVPFHNCATERLDVTMPLDDAFLDHDVNTVVHLAFILSPGRSRKEAQRVRQTNLKATQSVLESCRSAKVSNFVYLSSHTIYGAHKDNPMPLTETAPLRFSTTFQYAYDKAMCEALVQEFARENPRVNVTILRSCVALGPGADNFVTRAFFKPVLLAVRGYDPPLQFVHEDDLARLLRLFVMELYPGTFNVAGEGVITYSRMARLSRRRIVFLPSAVAYPLTGMAWTLGIQKDAPASGLDFIRHPMIVSTGKLKRETGFRFSYTSEDALRAYLPDRVP